MDEIDELYTVCTNGRHDPCCAAHGTPVYHELVAQAGAERVWQTTHIGGHRMAATLIAFPQGIVYGHVDPPDVEALVTNQRAGYLTDAQIPRARRLRRPRAGCRRASSGRRRRSRHPRAHAPTTAWTTCACRSVRELGADRQRVAFLDPDGGLHCAEVTTRLSAPRLTSCGDAPKPMPQHDVVVLAAD